MTAGPAERSHEQTAVELRPVDEDVLQQLVTAATADAAPDEVTPPLTPGPGWTPERIAWLRAFHRERRGGLDGPRGEATWAVVVDGSVVGSVRLQPTADPGAAETGLWLTRTARGRGVGRRVIAALLDEARSRGCTRLRAETTAGNAPARRLLEALGFELDRTGGVVDARLDLSD